MMGTGLNVDLGYDLILHDLGHDTDKAIARALGPRILGRRRSRALNGGFGEVFAFEVALTVSAHCGVDSSGVGPAANGVGARSQ